MPAPDPNDKEELAAAIAHYRSKIPDYSKAWWKKDIPWPRQIRFPEVMPPVESMTGEELAEFQVQCGFNEIDFIRTPQYVKDHLADTLVHRETMCQMVRYAWDRLVDQANDVEKAERLLDRLGLEGPDRGFGRRHEEGKTRFAQHVYDETWLASARFAEMKKEAELAGHQRYNMEMSEDELLVRGREVMEENCRWGNGPFDIHCYKPDNWIYYTSPSASEKKRRRHAPKGYEPRYNGNRRGGRGNAKHQGTGRGGPSNGVNGRNKGDNRSDGTTATADNGNTASDGTNKSNTVTVNGEDKCDSAKAFDVGEDNNARAFHFGDKGKNKVRGNHGVNGLTGNRALDADNWRTKNDDDKTNGSVNGQVNGHVAEHVNDLIEGKANGKVNGYANGIAHTNGYANGNEHVNGHVKGITNGHVNGYANGIGRVIHSAHATPNGHTNGNTSRGGHHGRGSVRSF